MTDKLRLAVVGAGGFAETCHIPGVQSHPQAEVAALCRRDRELGFQMAQKFGVPKVYTEATDLIADDEIDGITIATPNVSHHPIAIEAVKLGKHVFCEKPLAMNVAEASEMYDVAQASGCIHQVAFTFRYTHSLYKMRQMLREGAIGKPFFLRIQVDGWGGLRSTAKAAWRNQKHLSGTGILGDMGSHFFDVIRWLCGELTQVCGLLHNVPRIRPDGNTGQPTRIDTDDLAACYFETESGLQGQFFVSWLTPSHGENSYLEIIGEEGVLLAYLSRGNHDVLRFRERNRDWESVDLPAEASQGTPHALNRMMHSFVDGILRNQLELKRDASFFDGWKAQVAIDAVVESAEQRRWMDVECPE